MRPVLVLLPIRNVVSDLHAAAHPKCLQATPSCVCTLLPVRTVCKRPPHESACCCPSNCGDHGRVCLYAVVQVDMSDLEGAFLNVASQCMSVLMLDVNTRLDAGLQVRGGGSGELFLLLRLIGGQGGGGRPGGAGEGAAGGEVAR